MSFWLTSLLSAPHFVPIHWLFFGVGLLFVVVALVFALAPVYGFLEARAMRYAVCEDGSIVIANGRRGRVQRLDARNLELFELDEARSGRGHVYLGTAPASIVSPVPYRRENIGFIAIPDARAAFEAIRSLQQRK
ncbi:hypothetical protein SAMN06265365_11329 [Tistlia consotensis]|uniref:Uncharacterized protein n=1 Tax=Tistlia consotensis USBA 355 TaxID=560819 RepID=A0A1Y6C4T1_9PROT|nr:hypothetical protein [Tistlia consotensis]SMF41748.1 hypothetical protein SAMN05428998_114116 [Tistlia consotensis USBA 355]SNR73478.1 hypothetical protein SAMN06265365_11329 [Tistlia consotensis]